MGKPFMSTMMLAWGQHCGKDQLLAIKNHHDAFD